jgi:uncharacterized protein (TIGR02145 family)
MDIDPTSLQLSSHSNEAEFCFQPELERGYSVRCFKNNSANQKAVLENDPKLNYESESDQTGTLFNFIKIGGQYWMTQNLNVDRFKNGEYIIEAKTNEEWIKAGKNRIPAWCYYNNDNADGKKYGKLYNFFAIIDKRGLAPAGWHVSTAEETSQLFRFLGNNDGNKMKAKMGWYGEGNGSNISGFSALPGGLRRSDGVFVLNEQAGFWFTNATIENSWVKTWQLTFSNDDIRWRGHLGISFSYGCSVRCIKD